MDYKYTVHCMAYNIIQGIFNIMFLSGACKHSLIMHLLFPEHCYFVKSDNNNNSVNYYDCVDYLLVR